MNKYIINVYANTDIFFNLLYKIKKIGNWFVPKKKPEYRKTIQLNTSQAYKRKGIEYVTYNNLDPQYSAFRTLTKGQKYFWIAFALLTLLSLLIKPVGTLISIIGILTFIYLTDFVFTLTTIIRSFGKKSEMKFTNEELVGIDDNTLPKYTILCPLYKEWRVIEQFTKAIEIIDWPKEKLEVILLLEEDDTKTINKAYDLKLPSYFKIEVIPNSLPKTKPKACNWGLLKTTGEYVVIYDAEDKPDPLQLKKAYLAFKRLPENVACLQSKLNYYNQDQNLLTRMFTAEYSYWFDVALPGLQSMDTIIPLGGTSNHFKTDILRSLEGWDPFNVTEDCDLGTRIFKKGYKTSVIDSETLEEANSEVKSWIKQRSRWIKGYMQTYLVHMRNPIEFIKKYKHHAVLFQLIIGMRMVFMIINPFLWLMTIAYFSMYSLVGPFIESLYPWYIFYPAVFCLIFANFTYFYSFMLAAAKKDKWGLIKYMFFIPFYWILTSIAAGKAFYQLFTKPYYWEKTAHGLHIKKNSDEEPEGDKDIAGALYTPSYISSGIGNVGNSYAFDLSEKTFDNAKVEINNEVFVQPTDPEINPKKSGLKSVLDKIFNIKNNFRLWNGFAYGTVTFINKNLKKVVVGGGVLIGANLFANLSNYLFNSVMGRNLSYEDFGSTTLVTNINLLLQVITGAIFATVSYKSAILLGKRGGVKKDLWRKIQKNSTILFVPISLLIVGVSYLIDGNINNIVIISAVSATFILSVFSSINGGFLSGNLKFIYLAILVVLSPIIKFITGYFGMLIENITVIYFAQTVATLLTLLVSWIFISVVKEENINKESKENINFPKKFYMTSVMNTFSVAFFLSADVILANVFLDSVNAGKYSLLSLLGKTIYFLGSLIPQFITPIIGKEVGEGKDGLKTFYKLFPLTILVTGITYVILGVYPQIFAVLMFGNKVSDILPYISMYALAISIFTIAQSIASYHQARKQYIFSYLGFVLSAFEIVYLLFFHDSIGSFVSSIYLVTLSYFVASIVLHIAVVRKTAITINLISFIKLFQNSDISKARNGKSNILILNWRDTKHKWQGGAEIYIQEMAQRWVKKGYGVTIFCGNDGLSAYDDEVGGVKILRRGGFFTLYAWAFLYYVLRLRKHFDLIVDCENGVPFFSPLYSSKPKVLLIHHVHQTVFRNNLPLPLAWLAMFMESKLMKSVYKKVKIVTVSKSSQEDIIALGLSDLNNISIVNPGLDHRKYYRAVKFKNPTFSYLGRIMSYKNIDVLLHAFSLVLKAIPNANLIIAGQGPDLNNLKALSKKLNIINNVEFKGYVEDLEKNEILSKSWVMVQPSSFEGWGITVTEANASGTPVIASNTSGLRDSVLDGQTGLLVKTGSVEEFSRAMIALIQMHGFRERISSNAFIWSRNFNWSNSADKFLTLLNWEEDRLKKSQMASLVYSE